MTEIWLFVKIFPRVKYYDTQGQKLFKVKKDSASDPGVADFRQLDVTVSPIVRHEYLGRKRARIVIGLKKKFVR